MTSKIGHYDIVTELGRGGMGVVYKGHEPALNRYVAIKMLSPALAHDESIKERFLREARSMAALNDPHIIQIYFIGEENGQPYFAMEFVEGESLSSYLKRDGRLLPEQAARVIYQTAQGLATAHDKGVVHRDIKPANLMLNSRGHIKIADFGIALSSTDFSKKLTSTGEFVGTPGYLSPEVCTGKAVDLRSDIFSLGIVFFELLTGRMPFTDESPLGLMLEVVRAEIPDVRELNSAVDAELVRIIKRMTGKDPTERYQTCHELIADLGKHPLVTGGNTVSAKPHLSTAASTVLGMKTPLPMAARVPAQPTPAPINPAVSAQAALSNSTNRMQQPQAMAPEAIPAAPVRQSVLERQERQGGKGWVWGVAAVLALGVLGGTGYALRDRFGDWKSALGMSSSAQTAQTSTSSTTPATTTTPTNSSDANAALSQAVSSLTQAVNSATQAADTAAQQIATDATTQAANAIAQAAQDVNAATDQANAGIAGTSDSTELAADGEESLDPLRRMAAARKAELAGGPREGVREIASVDRGERMTDPPIRRGPPKVAVIALGDPAITGPAKQVIEESLMNQGFLLIDTDVVGGLGGGDLARNLAALHRAGASAVAVVRAEPLGSTQLNYYGQSDTLYSASLTVRTYSVETRSPLSAGVREKVDFTALNAEDKAREALEPGLSRVVGSLAAYRPKGQGG